MCICVCIHTRASHMTATRKEIAVTGYCDLNGAFVVFNTTIVRHQMHNSKCAILSIYVPDVWRQKWWQWNRKWKAHNRSASENGGSPVRGCVVCVWRPGCRKAVDTHAPTAGSAFADDAAATISSRLTRKRWAETLQRMTELITGWAVFLSLFYFPLLKHK